MTAGKNKEPYNNDKTLFTVIGLMSGTSMDGIDVALLTTDGDKIITQGAFETVAYDADMREALRSVLNTDIVSNKIAIREAEQLLTRHHIAAVEVFINKIKKTFQGIDLIGFHGHTIAHNPAEKQTLQIGDCPLMAAELGIDVVGDFRVEDVRQGGQGAPLVPIYHQALAAEAKIDYPLAILNLGGVANITYIGSQAESDLLAFDTGVGNALIDDWVLKHTGNTHDQAGKIARQGQISQAALAEMLKSDFYLKKPPKSLDRNDFPLDFVGGLSCADGAATLVEFTACSVVKALEHLPAKPKAIYVTGGGRHNDFMMERLQANLDMNVAPVELLGWNGDALEAQAFAYLAVRSLRGLPQTFPATTGCSQPLTGGVLYPAQRSHLRQSA